MYVPLYEGEIAWYNGEKEEAFRVWAEMEKNFPGEWSITSGETVDALRRDIARLERKTGKPAARP